MKALPWLALGALALMATGVGSACGSDEIGGGTGGVIQPGSGGAGGTPGLGGAPGSGGVVNNISDPKLGTKCTTDAECAMGLRCLPADSDTLAMGGPAGGLCTVDCTQGEAATAPCTAMNGICLGNLCYERCGVGDPPDAKCHQRHELACVELQGGGGVCLPQCNANTDCPAGRICDLGAALVGFPGVCRTTSLGGLPTGSQCDASVAIEQDPCNGICLPTSETDPTAGMCASGCTVGPPPGCGWSGPASAEKAEGACLFYLDTDNIGDAGFCAQLCDCDDDCLHPDAVCFGFGAVSSLAALFQRAGFCTPVADTMGTPCTGTGGMGGMGSGGSAGMAGGGAGP